MNARYRKQRRLRSRHHRRQGHPFWCRCPEPEKWGSFYASSTPEIRAWVAWDITP